MAGIDDIKTTVALQREYNQELSKSLEFRTQEERKLDAIQSSQEKINKLKEEEALGERDHVTKLEEKLTIQEDLVKTYTRDIEFMKKQVALRETLFRMEKSGNEEFAKLAKGLIEKNKLTQEELDQRKQILKQLQQEAIVEEKKLRSARIAEASIKETGTLLGIATDFNQTWLGQLENSLDSSASISGTWTGIKKGIQETLTPSKIFESSVSKVVEATIAMAYEMDTTLASFNKATGAGGEFNKVIDDVRFGSTSAGVGLEESARATESLFLQMTSFSQLNKVVQTELVRTTAELDRMGISAEITAKNLDISQKALGMNVEQAVMVQKEIASTAIELGVAPNKLASDFQASIPKLSAYGQQSVRIFKELAAQSKATGIEIGTLLGITSQYDTFEGAANAAGKLNAMLGGNLLNSVELLTATESERVELLRQAVSASGKNFNELSKFEKMAIASAAGINDINEANRLFGTSAEEFDKVRRAQEAEALSTQSITKFAAQATSSKEKLTKVVEGLTGASLPLVEKLSEMMNWFLKINDMAGGSLAPIILGLTGGIYVLSKAILLINTLTTAWTFVTGLLTTAKTAENAQTAISIPLKATETGATVATTGAIATQTTIRNASIFTMIKENAARIWGATVKGAEAVATWGMTAALIAYDTVVAIATGAAWLFNIALSANPIGLVVIAIALLIGWIVLLITHFDDMNGYITDFTGGLFDLWDVLLVGVPLFGPLILAGRKLYENWDEIITGLTGLWMTFSNFISGIFDGIVEKIKTPLNFGITMLNEVITKANIIPGVALPTIPALAEGATNFAGGVAMVGEEGPELVSLPGGANVITNENTNRLAEAGGELTSAKTELIIRQLATTERMIERQTNTIEKQNEKSGQKTIVLEVDKRELGRVVFDVFNDNIKLNSIG